MREMGSCQEFAVKTSDLKACLNGQVDYPSSQSGRAVAILAAGSGLNDRHVLAGESNTADDFFFDCLSADLSAMGIITVRYDSRGVSGNRRHPDLLAIDNGTEREKKFFSEFIDEAVRLTVTPKSQVDDLHTIYQFARNKFPSNEIILIGHSEGCLNIARLLAAHEIHASKILFLSPAIESPKSIVWWQRVGRLGRWLRDLAPGHETITIDHVRQGFGRSKLLSLYTIEKFLPYGGIWTPEMLAEKEEKLEDDYLRDAAWILTKEDTDPWPGPFTFSSFAWWKQWYEDETPLTNLLDDFKGTISCLFGDFDTQVEFNRQEPYLLHHSGSYTLETAVIPGVGHTFGYHGLMGPSELFAREIIKEKARGLVSAEFRS